nr:helix-turn-helix domain-containing protein [uncultured Limosilactobacillus sp.]
MCLKANGLSIRAIALRLGRCPSTISRELKRCSGNYSACRAEHDYHKKRQNCHKPLLLGLHPQLCHKIAEIPLVS